MDAQEPVRGDSTVEEGAELTLDEARDDPLLDTRMGQPSLEVVLDYAIESCRLGAARGVFGRRPCLAGLSHKAIVVPGSRRGQDATRIEFPRNNASRYSRPKTTAADEPEIENPTSGRSSADKVLLAPKTAPYPGALQTPVWIAVPVEAGVSCPDSREVLLRHRR